MKAMVGHPFALAVAVAASVVCSGSVRAEVEPLGKRLDPLREQWRKRELDDAHYRTRVLAVLKRHKVLPLWEAGFALGKTTALAPTVRLRVDERPVESIAAWTEITRRFATLSIGPPLSCSFGCCRYDRERPRRPIVALACFNAQHALTDLDIDTERPATGDDVTADDLAADKGPDYWLAAPAKIAWAKVLAEMDVQATTLDAQAEAKLRAVTVDKRWDAAIALHHAGKIDAADKGIAVRVVRANKRPQTMQRASWSDVLTQLAPTVGLPIACYADCCYVHDVALEPSTALRASELCFDANARLTRVTLDEQSNHRTLSAWLLERVQIEAKRSNWSPASRVDACLPAAVAPHEFASVWYCARRMDPALPDQAKRLAATWKYVDALALDAVRNRETIDGFHDFWLSRATTPSERLVREAALHPLAKNASGGVWVWGDVDEPREHMDSLDAFKAKYINPGKSEDNKGTRVLIGDPLECHNACCDYRNPQVGCNVGGGYPITTFIDRACFDASGATTDLYTSFDRYDDPDADPDEP